MKQSFDNNYHIHDKLFAADNEDWKTQNKTHAHT